MLRRSAAFDVEANAFAVAIVRRDDGIHNFGVERTQTRMSMMAAQKQEVRAG